MPDFEIRCTQCKNVITHSCNGDVRATAIRLFKWRPEIGFPEALKKKNPWADERLDDEDIPFLSEAYLYALLGKEDARTLMAMINNLMRAVGLEPYDIEKEANVQLDAEAKVRKERRERAERIRKLRAEQKK